MLPRRRRGQNLVSAPMSLADEGKDGSEREKGGGFNVFSSKWEAGLEGDRLCLLLICQAVNGESRVELGCQKDLTSQSVYLAEIGWGWRIVKRTLLDIR